MLELESLVHWTKVQGNDSTLHIIGIGLGLGLGLGLRLADLRVRVSY